MSPTRGQRKAGQCIQRGFPQRRTSNDRMGGAECPSPSAEASRARHNSSFSIRGDYENRTHVGYEMPSECDDVSLLFGDLQRSCAIIPARRYERTRRPDRAYEVILLAFRCTVGEGIHPLETRLDKVNVREVGVARLDLLHDVAEGWDGVRHAHI
jgi:hypothetical protein